MGTRIYTPLDLFETNTDMIEGSFTLNAMIPSQNECFRGLPIGFRTPVGNVYMSGSSVAGGRAQREVLVTAAIES